MKESSDNRSQQAIAYQWAVRIMTVSMEMVLPGVAGYWLDQRLRTKVLFTILGFGVGMLTGVWHLIRMTGSPGKQLGDNAEGVDGKRGEDRNQ